MAALTVLLAWRPAAAEAPPLIEEAAAPIFKEGYELFHAGRYEEALARFEGAHRILSNVHIVYYLGRTLAALDRCEEALPHLAGLRDKMPAPEEAADPRKAEEARRLRARDEARCRLALGAAALDAFRCHAAVELAAPAPTQDLPRDDRPRHALLLESARACDEAFETSDEAGQRAARLHAEAMRLLEAGDAAQSLTKAQASLKARDSRRGRLARGAALARLDRCQEALGDLGRVDPKALPASERRLHGRAHDRCRLVVARALVADARCAEAMPLLDGLQGRLRGADDRWRAEKAAWCGPRATPFMTHTVTRRSAHRLFVAARKARDARDPDDALGLYAKALALVDEPIIRRELADVAFGRADCVVVAETLAGIPPDHRTPRDRARLLACRDWAATRPLVAEALDAYVAAIEAAELARDEGDLAAARASLIEAHRTGGHPAAAAAALDVLFEQQACGDYLAQLGAADAVVRGHVTDAEARLEACRAAQDQPQPLLVRVRIVGRDSEDVSILVDGRAVAASEAGSGALVASVEPGAHTLHCAAAGTRSPELRFEALAAAPVADLRCAFPAPSPSAGRGRRAAALVALGAGAAAAGVGTWLALDALRKAEDVNSSSTLTCDGCELQSGLGWAVAGVGVAALATGALLLAIRPATAPSEPGVSFHAWADRHGALAFLRISTPGVTR